MRIVRRNIITGVISVKSIQPVKTVLPHEATNTTKWYPFRNFPENSEIHPDRFEMYIPNEQNMPDLDSVVSQPRRTELEETPHYPARKKKVVATLILLMVNLLNYIDRYTIVGVMDRLKTQFNMSESDSGMLQTAFILTFILAAPVFGYFGDRYNRKFLMMTGMVIWVLAVLASSFCGEGHYILFLICRAVVGIGEASYCTIAPTIISDLFQGTARSRVFMMFYFAIPVGSGLGFICGSKIALATDSWQWGVRFSPIIGVVCLALMIFLLDEPVRGACERARESNEDRNVWNDVQYLFGVKSYRFLVLGTTTSYFSVGCLSWWTPQFLGYASATIQNVTVITDSELSFINTMFGIVTCVAGLLGVATGTLLARAWYEGKGCFAYCQSGRADVYICALSMFISCPLLFAALLASQYSINWALIFFYFAIMSIGMNWAVSVDVIMCIIKPSHRSTAMAAQTMISHLFGDATSPYIIGILADYLCEANTAYGHYFALQKALYVPDFVLIIAGACYLLATFFVEKDRKECDFLMNATNPTSRNQPKDMASLVTPGGEGFNGVEEQRTQTSSLA